MDVGPMVYSIIGFSFLSIIYEIVVKKRRWCAWDSNLRLQDGRLIRYLE